MVTKYHDTLFISIGGNTELDQRSEIALAIITESILRTLKYSYLKIETLSSGKLNNENDRPNELAK